MVASILCLQPEWLLIDGMMKDTASLTIRVDRDLLRALKVRAIMNDRSANGELSAILKEVLNTKKAPDPALESKSDASTTTL